jgi:hypothetical protein
MEENKTDWSQDKQDKCLKSVQISKEHDIVSTV